MDNELRNVNNNIFAKCHTGIFFHLENLKPVLIFQQAYEPISLMDGGVSAIEGYEEIVPRCSLSVLQHDYNFDYCKEFVSGFLKIYDSWFQSHCASLVLKSTSVGGSPLEAWVSSGSLQGLGHWYQQSSGLF